MSQRRESMGDGSADEPNRGGVSALRVERAIALRLRTRKFGHFLPLANVNFPTLDRTLGTDNR